MSDRICVWVFTLWTVVTLLNAVLSNFSGILRVSKAVLWTCFGLASALGLLSAFPEYRNSSFHIAEGFVNQALRLAFIGERVMSSIALLALVAVLSFLLWFPVQIPRNLAVFSVGFLVYFSFKNLGLLALSFSSQNIIHIISVTSSIVAGACFAYWALFISAEGETVTTRLSRWKPAEQEKLMQQLEALNQSLVRSARR